MTVKQEFLSAVTKGDVAKVKELLKQDLALAGVTDTDGVSALLKALYYRQKEVADLLLASRVELNIFEASAVGRTERVLELLKKDQGLANAYAPDGFTPLGLAAFFGHKSAVEALLANGAQVNVCSRNALKAAPLRSAAVTGQIEIARLLLAHGADVNSRGEGGFTTLHEVATNGQVEFAKLLLDNGADVNARGDDGRSPLTIALESKQTGVATFLRDHGALQ